MQIGDPDPKGDGPVEIEIDGDADLSTLRFKGDLDAVSSTGLWRQLDDFEPTRTVTIDLTDVGFVDSSGIGCLFKLSQRVADAQGVLVATGATPALRSLMEATGLNRVIAIVS